MGIQNLQFAKQNKKAAVGQASLFNENELKLVQNETEGVHKRD